MKGVGCSNCAGNDCTMTRAIAARALYVQLIAHTHTLELHSAPIALLNLVLMAGSRHCFLKLLLQLDNSTFLFAFPSEVVQQILNLGVSRYSFFDTYPASTCSQADNTARDGM